MSQKSHKEKLEKPAYKCMKQYICEKVSAHENDVVCITVQRFFQVVDGHMKEVRPMSNQIGLQSGPVVEKN
ncbi:hypothetical protein POMI540_3710 [Schizosaccharomyces pombe]|uniref:Uncharacterized protein SPCC1259.16 n=1 Tax=Schizosaccharomyces pombe (strain 972 / ATCC 24843) TaxID=284812 RepID=YC5G_SCHPO|nr:uncharacterized protein SPCC1259.16 [Schizosaccharomyces pombe]G2TRU4.1 RecName: Full=Uncharacterized protein SPCC1259.16 [Schizosaccharomyces pombe 972h-]CCD31394.1 sequence orphan [Schizosaccharomyces pombe]|eukprot:NP_001343184.1 uncharacterized protein SPCC1259.16 [Schizosaccharomyces pombe]